MSGADHITVEIARRLLAVPSNVDSNDLRTAFNKAVKAAHPDHGGSQDKLSRVLDAYRVLEAWIELEAAGEVTSAPGTRLEITPIIAAMGGRAVTKLMNGKKLAIRLPAGLRNGDKVAAGGQILQVIIRGRPEIFVSGDDICMTVRASAELLRDGGRLKVKSPAGPCVVWIPRQVGTTRIVRVLGRGLPARGRHAQGALILKLIPEKGKGSETDAKLKRFSTDWAAA
ncbi:DnaJ domain-containing protein [soil metagenome]